MKLCECRYSIVLVSDILLSYVNLIVNDRDNWPARESRRSVNIAVVYSFGLLCMEKCSISTERSLVSLNMTSSQSLVISTMT